MSGRMYHGESIIGKATRKAGDRLDEFGPDDPFFLGMVEVIAIMMDPFTPDIVDTARDIRNGIRGEKALDQLKARKRRKLKRRSTS